MPSLYMYALICPHCSLLFPYHWWISSSQLVPPTFPFVLFWWSNEVHYSYLQQHGWGVAYSSVANMAQVTSLKKMSLHLPATRNCTEILRKWWASLAPFPPIKGCWQALSCAVDHSCSDSRVQWLYYRQNSAFHPAPHFLSSDTLTFFPPSVLQCSLSLWGGDVVSHLQLTFSHHFLSLW